MIVNRVNVEFSDRGLSPHKFMPVLGVHYAINSDSQKRRSFVAPLLAAGYGERCAS
jgi:hypothetical protein